MKKNKKKEIKGDVTTPNHSWLYSETVKEHFFHPRNVLLDEKNFEFDAKGKSGNPRCGDIMSIWLKVDPKSQKIRECKWRTYGCASAIAATSMLSIMLTEKGGMTLKKALNLKPEQIIKRLGGLPSLKFHCTVLGLSALKAAIDDYYEKQKSR